MANSEELSKKSFREKFYTRLTDSMLSEISRKTGIAQNTLYSWQQEGRGLPDIYEAQRIAEAKECDPCWLAFGAGERDPQLRALSEVVANDLRKIPSDVRVNVLTALAMAAGIQFAMPEQKQRHTPSQYPAELPLAEEMMTAQARLNGCLAKGVPVGSELWYAARAAATLLGQIAVALQQQSPQAQKKDSPASESGVSLAHAKSPRGRRKDRGH